MKKAQIVEFVSVSLNNKFTKAEATTAVDAVFDAILEAMMHGDSVQIPGFGKFEVRDRAARQGRNPKTGETIQIKASKNPAFKPATAFKKALNPDR
jgi:DNA-binding protein HU-beta